MVSLFEVVFVIILGFIFMIMGVAFIENDVNNRPEKTYQCVDSACYKKELIDAKSDTSTTTKTDPVKTEFIEAKKITEIKEEKIENHYHFQELNTGLMAFTGLCAAALTFFIFYKLIGLGRTSFVISKAKRKSEKLLADFDNVVDDVKRSIAYNKQIVEQVAFNNLLLEVNKGNPATSSLIVSNHMMKDKLIFIERKILNDFKN